VKEDAAEKQVPKEKREDKERRRRREDLESIDHHVVGFRQRHVIVDPQDDILARFDRQLLIHLWNKARKQKKQDEKTRKKRKENEGLD
jgi:hypothetical protein